MPSEHRLHWTSIVFNLVAQARQFVVPTVVFLLGAGWAGVGTYAVFAAVLVPMTVAAIVRYATFRYRYEPEEMVIRSGLLHRSERHVPYARIQNLDAEQNVFHRLLKVVRVQIETGGGAQAEATMNVVPVEDFETMRRRVFAARRAAADADATAAPNAAGNEGAAAHGARTKGTAAIDAATDAAIDATTNAATGVASPTEGRTLLRLSPGELLLHGLIVNRGIFVILGAVGFFFEAGLLDGPTNWLFGEGSSGRGVLRDVVRAVFEGGAWPWSRLGLALGALAGALLILWLVSPAWSLIRLHGFRVSRSGDDIRTEYGLLNHVIATIPAHRIQSVTIRESPLHRLFGRVSVKATTAGGSGARSDSELDFGKQREWLAPLIAPSKLGPFLAELLPDLDYDAIEWREHHPRAFRRELKQWVIVAILIGTPLALLVGWWTPVLFAALLAWAWSGARGTIAYMRWARGDGLILFRKGWLWRQIVVTPLRKVQVVALQETPFDRRNAMARLRIDTAGAAYIPGAEQFAANVEIPYLARTTAEALYEGVAATAAGTEFRW